MNWKNWPYWLRGGVIGGGVALVFYLLGYSCFWLATLNLEPGEVGFAYKCLLFYIVSPIYPAGWLMVFLEPIFHYGDAFVEAYASIVSIPVWFLLGSVIGGIVGYFKSKKKSPL